MRIVEVGARDGLQNEPTILPTEVKVELIARLADAGLRSIEAGAFVNPKLVPQVRLLMSNSNSHWLTCLLPPFGPLGIIFILYSYLLRRFHSPARLLPRKFPVFLQ